MTTAPTLLVAAPSAPIVSGEALHVRVLFRAGDAPWSVPAPDARSPLVFTLTANATGETLRLSLDDFLLGLRGEPGEDPGAQPRVVLSPGSALMRPEQIGDLTPRPIAPGTFMLRGHVDLDGELWRSPPSLLRVEAPRIVSAMSAWCPRRSRLVTALWHRDAVGHVLLTRESYPRAPDFGVFYRVGVCEAPDDLCVFLDTAGLNGPRWLAWRRGDALDAARVWGSTASATLRDIGPPWRDLRIAGPGYLQADASGHLLVVGEFEGVSHAACLRLHGAGVDVLWQHPLPAAPERVAASFDDAGRHWLVWTAGDTLYALCAAGGAQPGVASVQVVGALGAAPAAWLVPTWFRAGDACVHVLEAPDDAPPCIRTFALDADATTATPLPRPTAAVERWGVVAAPGTSPRALVVVEGVLGLFDTSGAWTRLGALDTEAPWFATWVDARGRPWVEWNGLGTGIVRVAC